jgi:hypothetical protein
MLPCWRRHSRTDWSDGTNNSTRIPGSENTTWHIFRDDTPRTDDGALLDPHPRTNNGAASNPYIIADLDGLPGLPSRPTLVGIQRMRRRVDLH